MMLAQGPLHASAGNGQRNELLRRSVYAIEMAASVDEFGELRRADSEARGDRADTAGFCLEVPDEFAARAYRREMAAVFCEHGDPRPEQRAAHCRDQGHAVHQVEYLGRVGLARAGPVAEQ